MNIWVCIILGFVLAVAYKAYKVHKTKQSIKNLQEQLNKEEKDNK